MNRSSMEDESGVQGHAIESNRTLQALRHSLSAISDQERRKILDSVLDKEIIYRNPRMEGTGHQILMNDIHEFQERFPGGAFTLDSESEHHDVALMEWQLILADGTPGVRGHDSIRITPQGKFGHIVTFAPSTLEPQA